MSQSWSKSNEYSGKLLNKKQFIFFFDKNKFSKIEKQKIRIILK